MLAIEGPEKTFALKSYEIVTVPEAPPEPPKPAWTEHTVLRWLPRFWQRSLFPASAPVSGSANRASLAALLVISSLMLYPSIGFELFEPDEGRYAQIPRETLERGAWLVPTLQGEPYLDKPPLFYWLVMLSYSMFGYHAWAARLVPALAMQGTMLIAYLSGRKMLGERVAWLGAMAALASPIFLGMGRLLVLDGLLTFWVTACLFAAYRAQREAQLHWGWWGWAGLACGLGVLTKGPIAPLLVLPPLLAHRWLASEPCRIGALGWGAFLGMTIGLALPWYAAILWAEPEFGPYFFWRHNVMRFVEPFDHERPVWFFAPIILGGLAPLTLLGIPILRFYLSSDKETAQQRTNGLGFLLLAGGWCVFFFSLSGCKLPTYILPALAPLCLVGAAALVETSAPMQRWRKRVFVGFLAVCLAANAIGVPLAAWMRSPLYHREDVLAVVGATDLPVVCFPRNIDSVAFFAGRDDFVSFRSKDLGPCLDFLDQHPRVAILFGHRSSKSLLLSRLPPHLRLTNDTKLGLTDLAVVERIAGECAPRR